MVEQKVMSLMIPVSAVLVFFYSMSNVRGFLLHKVILLVLDLQLHCIIVMSSPSMKLARPQPWRALLHCILRSWECGVCMSA